MPRTANPTLDFKGLSHGAFYDAVRGDGYLIRERGPDMLICRPNDVKAQYPVYKVERGAVLPETSRFNSRERADIARCFPSLSFNS